MRRKIAFYITLVVTAVLVALRFIERSNPAFALGPIGINECLLVLSGLAIVAVAVLCFSKTSAVIKPTDTPISTVNGWLCTFCGAVVTMSAAMDIFCWIRYDQVPPPASYIYNRIDLVASIASLVFGVLAGVYLIMQGFAWMSQNTKNQTLRNWLALTPVLWMWFRLARYEISYASTIDIRESFFDFAVLVFASLFFLQLARMVSGIGAAPKNGLVIFALGTAMTALADAPVAMADASNGMPIGNLLIAMSDLVIGFFALTMAALQVFPASSEDDVPTEDASPVDDAPQPTVDDEDGLAWTEPTRDLPPLEPAFDINHPLPSTETKSEAAPATKAEESDKPTTPATPATPMTVAPQAAPSELTIDDLLSEIDTFEP